jgi:hypothetical protein
MREGIMTRVSHRASEASLSNESASDSRDGVSLPGVFNDRIQLAVTSLTPLP